MSACVECGLPVSQPHAETCSNAAKQCGECGAVRVSCASGAPCVRKQAKLKGGAK